MESIDTEMFGTCHTPVDDDHEEQFGIPTLSDLGLNPSDESVAPIWLGGETEALRRLAVFEAEVCGIE